MILDLLLGWSAVSVGGPAAARGEDEDMGLCSCRLVVVSFSFWSVVSFRIVVNG